MTFLQFRHLLKYIAIHTLSLVKIYPAEQIEKHELQSLLPKLYPISAGRELIRLGPAGDGGYLVPDDLKGIEACFSPGVSKTSGFEIDCANLGMKVFLADGSVEQPAERHELFNFTKKHLGAITNNNFMTIDDWVAASLPGRQSDLMMQMDIEGFEYETFLSISEKTINRFRIIVAEFHFLDELLSRPFYQIASSAFKKILQTHTCVHIHPNNYFKPLKKWGMSIPSLAEFTFLRNDRVNSSSYARVFPHPLDADNTKYKHYSLPKCWYGSE